MQDTLDRTKTARILAYITTRDEQGRHFTERYDEDTLDQLEEGGLIRIDRPVHKTGIPYGREHWSVELTEEGSRYVERFLQRGEP